jgi:beta-N-acetylhexosaminidase
MHHIKATIFLTILISITSCNIKEKDDDEIKAIDKTVGLVNNDSTWVNLTLREKIGQTMLMLPDQNTELKIGNGSLQKFFDLYPVGGFFLGWKLFNGIDSKDFISHQKQSVIEYLSYSKYPLLFQQDYENGLGGTLEGLTIFPDAMNFGAANDPDLSYGFGEAVAKECKSVGINWVLHPVADLNMNRYNPITSVRSVGDKPEVAISLLQKQIQGLQSNGVAATIKHFPGDGVDVRDQHLVTTTNYLTKEQWWKNHGKVFQELINAGVYTIMPGHIRLPFYQKEKIHGFLPPATLSKELLTGLLKKEMNFNGVIISDAMVMGGFRGYYESDIENEIKSFEAGVDMMLWPSYAYMDTLEARILRNEIPESRLNDAVHRVWNLKKRLGILDAAYEEISPLAADDLAKHKSMAKQIAKKSITQLSGSGAFLNNRDDSIAVVYVTPISKKGGSKSLDALKYTASLLREKGYFVHEQHNLLYEDQFWSENLSSKYDKILFLVSRRHHEPFGPLQFYDKEAQSVWAINSMPKEKLAVISYGDPYLYTEYFERVQYFLNAYSTSDAVQEEVVDIVTGEYSASGKSPVKLDFVPQIVGAK